MKKRKKPQPFNPFAPNAQKKKPSKPSTTTRSDSRAVSYKAPPLASKPPVIDSSAPKPAIPTSHLAPEKTPIQVEKEEPVKELVEQKEEVEVNIEIVSESGPALASGKVRSVGLRKIEDQQQLEGESDSESDDERVLRLKAQSKALAADSGLLVEDETVTVPSGTQTQTTEQEITEVKKTVSEKAFEKRKQMMAKKRKARAAAPPTKRIQKLNRRKYMEFKVDIREIMDEENVMEEHRANLLGSTWAKGERQGIHAAIEFVEEKLEDQIITDNVAERMIKVLKGYRKVR